MNIRTVVSSYAQNIATLQESAPSSAILVTPRCYTSLLHGFYPKPFSSILQATCRPLEVVE